ncbi:hypothetical protein BD779DRAFT_1474657 [Infundibulicybe gibba]|nr:hypothetical protein BD779DRAFT_1474657 [Infundibulicybe gibba]
MAPTSALVAGPLLIGFLLNTGLFGILSIQTYEYYLSFPNDKLHLKFLTYGVFLAEMAQTALTICDAYWIFVTGFGDTSVLVSMGRMYWIYSPVIGGLLVIATHMYSAHRISILYNSRTIGFIVAAIWTVVCSICSITITILMTIWLLRWGDTGSKTTWTIVSRLLRLSLETGAMLAALAIIGLVLLVDNPKQPYFLAFVLVISKCHAVSWLALLNNRTRARQLEDTIPTTNIRFQAVGTGVRTDTWSRTPVPVAISLTHPSILVNSVPSRGG